MVTLGLYGESGWKQTKPQVELVYFVCGKSVNNLWSKGGVCWLHLSLHFFYSWELGSIFCSESGWDFLFWWWCAAPRIRLTRPCGSVLATTTVHTKRVNHSHLVWTVIWEKPPWQGAKCCFQQHLDELWRSEDDSSCSVRTGAGATKQTP